MRKQHPAISSKWASRIAAIFATTGIIAGLTLIWPTIRTALSAPAPAIASVGGIVQGEALVGFAVGARLDKHDPTRLDFTEITNAARFDVGKQFEYQNYQLRVSRVHVVRDASSPGGGRTLAGVTATIVSYR
jgi:hypothetical protein